jgi:predicted RNase H-like HicB family nuclease/DNA-binding XRE family transcriptional regulator
MRFPALITEKDGLWVAKFRDCPGCEVRCSSETEVLPRAQRALERWLTGELQKRRAPPHPSRRIQLWKRERLLRVPVSPEVAVPILIRWARSEAGLTQADLAERLGIGQPRIADLETPGANPSLETLSAIAAALNLRFEISFFPKAG